MPSCVLLTLSNMETTWFFNWPLFFSLWPVLPVGTVADIFKGLRRTEMQACPLSFCLDNHLKCDFKGDERLQIAVT